MSVSPGRMAGSVALALVVGALIPLIAVLQISLLAPVLMLCGILGVHFRARAGWPPAALLYAAALGSTLWLIGPVGVPLLLLAAILPALFVSRGVMQKQPFFRQLDRGVAAYAAGLVAAMVAAYAVFGGGMIARFVDVLREEFTRMPDAALQPFADAVNSALSLGGTQGAGTFTVQMYREQLAGILDLMQQTYAQMLPGTLLSGALLSGVLSVLWGNWTLARQGMATNESFIGIGRWFLPPQVTLGALGLWAAGFLLANSAYKGGATVYATIAELAGSVFVIQALCAVDRKLMAGGGAAARRKLLITVLAVVALIFRGLASILSAVGVMSALFGSHGAFKLWTDRRQNNHTDRDDPDQ